MNSFNGSIYSEERGYYALVRSEIDFQTQKQNTLSTKYDLNANLDYPKNSKFNICCSLVC